MISCSGTREATVSRCHDRRTGSPQAARTLPKGLLTSDRPPAQCPPTRASMFRSRGCRQTRAWRRQSLGRRRKHGDGTTSDDFDGCRSRRRASLPVIHVCRRLFLPRRSSARLLGGGACATRTLSTRQSTRAEIGAPQQHPCAPHALQEGLGGTPIGRQGLLVPAPSPGPPSKAPSGPCATSSKQAGRLLGRAIPFFFFPRLDEEGSGMSRRARLADRVEGWDATAGAADGGRSHR